MNVSKGLTPKMDTPEQRAFWEFVFKIKKEVEQEVKEAQERWARQ